MTIVTTMAVRVGSDDSLLHMLSLREDPSQLEENQSSVVADRHCHESRGSPGEGRGGQTYVYSCLHGKRKHAGYDHYNNLISLVCHLLGSLLLPNSV